MKSNKKKNKIALYSFIIFLVFGTIYVVIDSLFGNTPTSVTNQVNNGVNNKDVDSSNVLFSEGEEIFLDNNEPEVHPIGDAEHGFTQLDTIFEENVDTTKSIGLSLSKPVVVDDFSLSSHTSKISLSTDGHIIVYANDTQLQYYNPEIDAYQVLASDVTNVSPSEDGNYLIFEQKQSDGYHTYQFDFMNTGEITELSSSFNPLTLFGRISDFYYFKTQENPNDIYYMPTPDASDASKLKGMNVLENYNILKTTGDNLVTYSENGSDIYMSAFGDKPVKQFTVPLVDKETLIALEISPFEPKSVKYVALISPFEDEHISSRVLVNGKELEDIKDVVSAQWIDKNLILFNVAEMQNNLYVYDTIKKEKYLLAGNVSSATYDYKQKTIYYSTVDANQIRKIIIQN